MKVRVAGLLAALGAVLSVPAGARAATCADHPNQAAAQRAADTRDADGDGVYCESLSCPCLRSGAGGTGRRRPSSSRPGKRAVVISARVTSVVDGDTIRVRAFGAARRFHTVRLIGIDTPETRRPGRGVECGGPQATRHMKRLAPRGLRVTLRTDPTQDTYDRYGRLLAYVSRRSGSLQVLMLRAGWAKVYVYGGRPFARVDKFRAAQRTARSARRGAWSKCGGDFHRLA